MPRPPTNGYRKPRVQVIPYTHAPVTEQHDAPDVFIGGVILDSPANAAETTDRTPLLAWFAVNNATEYQVQADEDVAFGSPEIDELVNTISYAPSGDLAYEEYNWRVRVTQPFLSEWSAVRTFTLKPIAPTLDSPADDPGAASRLVDYTPALAIAAAIPDVALHRWQVATDAAFSTIVLNQTEAAPTTTHTPGSDLDYSEDGFWWRVRAEAASGVVSDWSTPRQFFLHTYQSYTALQIASAGGGAEWPMNDEAGNQVIDNRANTDPASSTNLLTNGDMESWASATNLNNWTESTAGSSTVNQETSDVHGGSNACRLDVDGAQSAVGIVQNIATTLGKTYRVRWWAKVNDATGGPTMRTDVSSNTGLSIPLTTTYAQYMRRVVASSTNPSVVPQRSTNCANRSIYLDDFEIVEDGDHDLQPPNANIGTLYQRPGEGGENDAIEMDGSVGMLTYYRYTNGRNTLYIHFMINPDATGANDRLIFKSGELDVFFNSDGTVSATANYSSSNATCTTSTTFSTGAWQHFAFSLSDSDKMPRIYKNGVECAYASQTAGVGTRSSTTNPFQLFKDGGANGFDGKAQKGLYLPVVPSSTVIANLYALRNRTA